MDDRQLYRCDDVPVLNNVLFTDRQSALAASTGTVRLVQCDQCGFVFNAVFDPDLLKYTEAYDSSRGQSVFVQKHLNEVTDFTTAGLPERPRILEIGCGDGSFLAGLHQRLGGESEGFDVTCRTGTPVPGLKLYGRHFHPEIEAKGYDLVLMRHVLEHIPRPGDFIEALAVSGTVRPGGRLVVEVPDLAWIIDNQAFFDITYEHCNYFDAGSLSRLLAKAGFASIKIMRVFGEQYLLASAIFDPESIGEGKYPLNLYSFSGLEKSQKDWVYRIKHAEFPCVWGASGKGCLALAALNVDILNQISHVIDTNSKKQGYFMPKCGLKIESPVVLQSLKRPATVFVMNPVYRHEIAEQILSLGVEATLEIVS